MSEVKVTNIIKFYTILLLYKKPMHGYELIKKLKECAFQNISASHVYPFLKLLKKNKLIALKDSGKREKKQYNLTKDGKKFANEMINRFSVMIDTTIKKKVKKCAHCSCKVYEGGYKTIIKKKQLYFCCVHCAKSFKN